MAVDSSDAGLQAQPSAKEGPPSPRAKGRKRIVAVLSLLGATLFWAGNYVVGAGAVQSIEPLSLVLLRWPSHWCP